MKKTTSILLLSLFLHGCATNSDLYTYQQNKRISDKELSYINKNSNKNYIYSQREVQFILTEGRDYKITIDMVIDGNSRVYLSNERNKKTGTHKLVGAKVTANNYSKDDFYIIDLEVKNHWNNEYLVAKVTRDYTFNSNKTKSNLHYATKVFTLGRHGELVPQKLNLPMIDQ